MCERRHGRSAWDGRSAAGAGPRTPAAASRWRPEPAGRTDGRGLDQGRRTHGSTRDEASETRRPKQAADVRPRGPITPYDAAPIGEWIDGRVRVGRSGKNRSGPAIPSARYSASDEIERELERRPRLPHEEKVPWKTDGDCRRPASRTRVRAPRRGALRRDARPLWVRVEDARRASRGESEGSSDGPVAGTCVSCGRGLPVGRYRLDQRAFTPSGETSPRGPSENRTAPVDHFPTLTDRRHAWS